MSDDIIYLLVIAALVTGISGAFIFLSFYCVLIYAALEEGDEVFDFCGIGVVRMKNRKWIINGRSIFDENAVVKVRYGFMFRELFWDWDIWIDSDGQKKGFSKGVVAKETCFLRRKIRRNQ